MKSKAGLIFAFLALIASISAIGFFVWQSQNIIRSLDRIASSQEETSREILTSLVRTEGQIRRVRETIRLLDVEEWLRGVEKPLADKLDNIMVEAQRRGLEQALLKWSEKVRQREDEQWQGLIRALRKDREDLQKRYQQEEKRWLNLVETLRKNQEAAKKESEREEGRWLNLMETLQRNQEATQKQYQEVVQKISKERAKALERARKLEEERQQEITKLLEQAKQIDQERKRRMFEFCSKRPESIICREF
ncbi:MAG: hypothetical protein ACE5JU_11310 [Candidatus Binatia bacterium]